jgi:amidase
MEQDIFHMSLLDIAEKIHRQEISSVEVTLGLIQRIEQLDTKLLSYVNVLKKQALDAA